MSSAQAWLEGKAEEFVFVTDRHPDKSGWLKPSDIVVGKKYITQYGETVFVTAPEEGLNPHSGEPTLMAKVKIVKGYDIEDRVIDLVWVGLMPNEAGLWRKGAFCNDFFHDLSCELI